MIYLNGVFILTILTLILYITVVFWPKKDKKVNSGLQKIPLSQIARLWADSKDAGQVHIKDIAPLWRRSSITKEERSDYIFTTEYLENFFNKMMSEPWFDQADAHKEICYQLLRMLEDEGDCPSVVNPSQDVEGSWDTNTYNMLGRTTLLEHTLHVVKNCGDLLIKAQAHHVIPDTMVAALAHDIGKLPSNRTHLYSLGEHPLAAGRILAQIDLFKTLSRKDEILRAVKHHHMRAEGLLGKTLKKADQKARQQELEEATNQRPKKERKTKQAKKNGPPLAASQNTQAQQAEEDIYDESKNLSSSPRSSISRFGRKLNISTWFDPQIFLKELKPYINQLEGRRFTAFSMPNGYVYFQTGVIEKTTRKLAQKAGAMDIATMAAKDTSMQKVLLSVVDTFRNEHDLIARDLIKEHYFGGYFKVKMNGGKILKGYYTPFKAEAFGSIAEMEKTKKGLLKNFTSVDIYQD